MLSSVKRERLQSSQHKAKNAKFWSSFYKSLRESRGQSPLGAEQMQYKIKVMEKISVTFLF